jgi:hypothetical protein
MSNPFPPINVSDLIDFLQGLDPKMPIAFALHSDLMVMTFNDIHIEKHCAARPDGWVQSKRPDMPEVSYLIFPGN